MYYLILIFILQGGHTEIVELFLKTSVIEKNIFSEGGEILIAAAFVSKNNTYHI